MSKYRLLKHSRFDFSSAQTEVFYSLWYEHTTRFRKRTTWRTVEEWMYDSGGGSKVPVYGDIDWAKRIAKELKIEVPS